jgi:superoxide dismutase, Cu-Zn family
MRTTKTSLSLIAAFAIAIGAGCVLGAHTLSDAYAQSDTSVEKAIAVLTPTEGNKAEGVVTFTQTDEGVKIVAHISGLTPGQEHGFHIHAYGDLTAADGTSAGGHFNPKGTDHGGPHDDKRHVGDLGNIKADDDGHGMYERVDEHVSLDMADPACIIGRGVIVHGGTDDLETQPTGDAGPRIAHGVVGVANTE